MDNMSSHQHFVLNGFEELGALRPVLFVPFSLLFVESLLANSLLIYVVLSQRHLHQPMCVLIAGNACVDVCVPVFVVPHMLLNFLFDWRGISLIGCLTQMHFIHLFGTFHSTFLVWMALDRYFAICTPLCYHKRTAPRRFLVFIVPLVFRNVVIITQFVILAGRRSFCSGVIHHCFCEHMALVALACGGAAVNSLAGLIAIFLIPVLDFLIIVSSYAVVFVSVLTSSSASAKALHTCITHLVVLVLNLSVALIALLSYRFRNGLPAALRVFFSSMYLLVPCCFNPIIYGVRTTEIRQHMLKVLTGWTRVVRPVPCS